MRLRISKTLRVRLMLWTMLINAVLLALLVTTGWLTLHREQDAALNTTLKLSATQLTTAVDNIGGNLVPSADEIAVLSERGVFGWILDSDQRIHGTFGHLAIDHPPDVATGELVEHALQTTDSIRLFRGQLAEVRGSVVVGMSTQPLRHLREQAILTFVLALLPTLALSALGGLFVAERALSPITAITAQAQRISRDNLTERLALSGPRDEVLQLANTFDIMLDRLQAAFENERRFTADVSHELRTPLSLLKAQLTLAVSRPRDAQTLTEMMIAMDGDVDRMTRLVDIMLTLARLDAPLTQHDQVNIHELLSEILRQLSLVYAAHQIQFVLHEARLEHATTLGNRDLLMQLFVNLLDNAAKFSPDHGKVMISIQANGAYWHTTIADDGIGIAPEHVPHLFDRFYRVDQSRTRQSGGVGLGLAIAQAIAKQHQGYIRAQSALGLGSTFTVALPRQL